jgi:DNA modification methylase
MALCAHLCGWGVDERPQLFRASKKPRMELKDFENKVIQGDCLEVMKELPSNSIDMILCDLPYGTTQNKWDSVIPLDKLWEQYERIIKENGAVVLTAQGLFTAKLILSNERLFKYKIVWIKSKPTNFLNAKIQPLRKHEDICIFYKKQPVYNPQMIHGEPYDKGVRKDQYSGSYGDFKPRRVKSDGERYPNDVIAYDYEEYDYQDFIYCKTAESEGKVLHPTQKPVELGRYLVKTYTNESDIVLDNACGSGSFLVSAILENRRFIGIEKNENVLLHKKEPVDYIDICNQRIAKAKQQADDARRTLTLFNETLTEYENTDETK